ncbi:hypothetical protein C8R43DRAFT_1132174 [Mycena crocata]|nr:hypothetical protein C8R43DRAFT_1132174 [Mycena crocata]
MALNTLPRELIDWIICGIGDSETLKACTLVHSALRGPSQRILISSTTLGDHATRSYRELLDIFEKSPHIATYIRKLLLHLPSKDAELSEVECFQPIMDKLAGLSRLIVNGETSDAGWDDLAPGVADGAVQLIQRQTRLEGLHVMSMHRFPVNLIPLVLSSASTVSFLYGSIDMELSSSTIGPVKSLENLLLFAHFQDVAGLLATDDYAPYLANLRKLWVCPQPETSGNIIATAAPTLEEICFDCAGWDLEKCPVVSLPVFPSLQVACIRLHLKDRDTPWFVRTMCALLRSPAEEIIVSYLAHSPFPSESPSPDPLSPGTMEALNRVLEGRLEVPEIRWYLDLEEGDEYFMGAFAECVDEGIPLANEMTVEYPPAHGGMFRWPGGEAILPI